MVEDKLGPMPVPETEPAEANPGGADAINEDAPFTGDEPENLGRDLHPDLNPEVEDHVPDELTQPDDKQQEPTGDGDDREADTTAKEPPA
jgi:hypothetical protein